MQNIEGINIAVEGCFHGNADEIFGTIVEIEKQKKIKIDVLLVCGDVQTHRNKHDMYNMACPVKYLSMGSFYKYYIGEKVAPCLTIFIGGNHEASNYLREMYFGGWVAPNIYYLGSSNVIQIKKGKSILKLGGISGIFKIFDFNNPKYDQFPFTSDTLRNVYHIKQFDIFKFNLYEGQIDIFLSHDWPQQIHQFGNVKSLLQKKKNFSQDIKEGKLGSLPNKYLLDHLKPKFWFAAHMHVKFEAFVKHNQTQTTKFLALDKCLPGRDFLQILTITKDGQDLYDQFADNNEPTELQFDPEWLAVVNATYKLLTIWDKIPRLYQYEYTLKEYKIINKEKFQEFLKDKEEKLKLLKYDNLKIQNNFQITAPPYNVDDPTNSFVQPKKVNLNNQIIEYLKLFNESGQELNGFCFIDPDQPRIIGEFQVQDLVQKQIQVEQTKENIKQQILQELQGQAPKSPIDDVLDIQEFPFL